MKWVTEDEMVEYGTEVTLVVIVLQILPLLHQADTWLHLGTTLLIAATAAVRLIREVKRYKKRK